MSFVITVIRINTNVYTKEPWLPLSPPPAADNAFLEEPRKLPLRNIVPGEIEPILVRTHAKPSMQALRLQI